MFGEFDFRSTPLAPPGIKVIAHVKPQTRASWDLHGVQGFYTGPVINHYRCITCFFSKTRSERVCDTVKFLPHTIPIPKTNIDDYLRQSAQDIITILSNPPSTTVPSLTAGDPVRNALLEIAQQLGRVEPLTVPNKKDTDNTSPPRVYDPQSLSFDAQLPRVNASSSLTNSIATRNTSPEVDINTSVLEPQSGIIKNNRF